MTLSGHSLNGRTYRRPSPPAVGGEADAADGSVEVEVMEDGSGDEADQQRRSVWDTETRSHFCASDPGVVALATVSPSSTRMARFPSGDRPTQVMFLLVDTGRVSDVLLGNRRTNETTNPPRVTIKSSHVFNHDLLLQVEHRDAVPDRADHGVPVSGEAQVPLPVHGPEQVRELDSATSRARLGSKHTSTFYRPRAVTYLPGKQTSFWRSSVNRHTSILSVPANVTTKR